MDDAGQDWAAATGYRSLVEALGAEERDQSEIRRKRPHREAPRAAERGLDRVLMLMECFEQLQASVPAGPDWPPRQDSRQPFFFLGPGGHPTRPEAAPVHGVRPAGPDPTRPRSRRATPPIESSRSVQRPPHRSAGPLTAFITTFVITLPVVFVAGLFLPPATPYPEWGMKALAELTFAGAAGRADAAASAPAPNRAKRDLRDAAAGPRLAVAQHIEAKVDEAVPFPVAVQGIEALGEGSGLVVRGLPDHAALSPGEPLEPGAWRVDARWAANLTLTLRRRIDSPQAISVELMAPDGEVVVAAASTTLVGELAAPGG